MTYRAGTNDIPFLYNGRYGVMTDPNGLLYMRARYYNPYLSRFINPDPSGFAGGLNFYAYANGDPVSLIDPFGLCAANQNQGSSWLNTYNSIASTVVPGQVAWNNAVSAFQGGYYGTAAIDTVSMVGQQLLFVASLGTSSEATPVLSCRYRIDNNHRKCDSNDGKFERGNDYRQRWSCERNHRIRGNTVVAACKCHIYAGICDGCKYCCGRYGNCCG